MDFSTEEWEGFGVDRMLASHFIKSGSTYYKPVPPVEVDDDDVLGGSGESSEGEGDEEEGERKKKKKKKKKADGDGGVTMANVPNLTATTSKLAAMLNKGKPVEALQLRQVAWTIRTNPNS